jgi:RNA polymerase sigma factor (sigma-70 family)
MTASRHPAMALDAETLLQHSAWLAKFARALVANESELDDVVQQTYAQALAQPPRHARNLRGWLGAIARNVVRTRARSDSARVAREVAVPPPTPVETPDQAVERAELRRSVVEAVLALNEPYRSTVILRFFEEQEVAAVARLTKTGEDTVRTRLRRGVARVRELLERRVVDEKPGAADEGAAARALLYVHLREIAASAGRPAGAGGGGATGSAAASRDLVREGGRRVASATTRRILVGAATVVVAAGGWWAWKESGARSTASDPSLEKQTPLAADSASHERPAATAVVAERSDVPTPPSESPAPPSPPPRRILKLGTVNGLITDVDGKPVAGARVWAIGEASHDKGMTLTDFARAAKKQAEKDASGTSGGEWRTTTTGEDGRYEINELSTIPGWTIGAFEATTGAFISEVFSFDHEHHSITVTMPLCPGTTLRGSAHDEDGTPIGNAQVILYSRVGRSSMRTTIMTAAHGTHVGEFDIGFRCAESAEFECSAPGFIASPRSKVRIDPHAKESMTEFTLKRRPGVLVRGRIIDPTGNPLDLVPLLLAKFPLTSVPARAMKVTLRAIGEGSPPAEPNAPPATDAGSIEGRIDYVRGMYDVVVPDRFRGSLELRIAKAVVGTVALDDPSRPPDLTCDPGRIPGESTSTVFSVRYVDAETKEPIDLEHESVPPQANDGTTRLFAESDRRHGLMTYACEPGTLRIQVRIRGYATGTHEIDVPKEPAQEPRTLEVPRASSAVRGVVLHPDGHPFAKDSISLYRRSPTGWIDVCVEDTVTNLDGEFEFPSLARGEHVVVASGQGDETPGIARFTATETPADVEIHTVRGRATRFRISPSASPAGAPETRFRILDDSGVILEDLDRNPGMLVQPPDDLSVALADGRYTALVSRAGFRERRLAFDVPAGDAIVIPLEPLDARAK